MFIIHHAEKCESERVFFSFFFCLFLLLHGRGRAGEETGVNPSCQQVRAGFPRLDSPSLSHIQRQQEIGSRLKSCSNVNPWIRTTIIVQVFCFKNKIKFYFSLPLNTQVNKPGITRFMYNWRYMCHSLGWILGLNFCEVYIEVYSDASVV